MGYVSLACMSVATFYCSTPDQLRLWRTIKRSMYVTSTERHYKTLYMRNISIFNSYDSTMAATTPNKYVFISIFRVHSCILPVLWLNYWAKWWHHFKRSTKMNQDIAKCWPLHVQSVLVRVLVHQLEVGLVGVDKFKFTFAKRYNFIFILFCFVLYFHRCIVQHRSNNNVFCCA